LPEALSSTGRVLSPMTVSAMLVCAVLKRLLAMTV
jgi:hypothetical protein